MKHFLIFLVVMLPFAWAYLWLTGDISRVTSFSAAMVLTFGHVFAGAVSDGLEE